jgi:hypothetical protein
MANSSFLSNFRIRTTNHAWMDFALLTLILTLLNLAIVGVNDWGWLALNPSPWLIIPLFLGVRYGFRPGFGSGIGIALLIFIARSVITINSGSRAPLGDLFAQNVFFFLALPAIGFLAGESHTLLAKKLIEASERIATLEKQKTQADARLDVAEESRHQLQERLALFGAEQSNLDRQLRALFEPTAGAIFPNLLLLLRDMVGVTDAAIYSLDGSHGKRLALVGGEQRLPQTLNTEEHALIKLALSRREMVTLKALWSDTPEVKEPYMLALPWLGPDGKANALLLVHRMHFLATTWRNIHRIQLVCRWVAQFVDLRVQSNNSPAKLPGKSAVIVTPTALNHTIELADATHRNWKLPSTMAIFEFTENVPEEVANFLPQTVSKLMRPTDVGAMDQANGRPVFKVLLPMDGAASGEALLEKALAAIAKVPQLAGKVSGGLALTDGERPALA